MSEPSPPGAAPSAGGAVSPNRTLMIVLAYLWILFLVPLLGEKEDREVQWHAKHGLVITVAEIVFWLAVSIVNTMLSTVAPGLGCIVAMVLPTFALALLVLRVFCIVKGTAGQRLLIPGVSVYADRF